MKEDDFYRKRAIKRLMIVAGIVVIAAGAFWYFSQSDPFQKISSIETSAERIAAEGISKTFSAPPPLVATSSVGINGGTGLATANEYTLTRAGVIADTNAQRAANGNLPALAENASLDDIASLRLADMFARQYFAHFSPPDANGATSSAETVAVAVGYNYIALGENLALGNFAGDQGVVAAWMNSPGHRANILDTHYTQIGVAVGEGSFQGNTVWIAVQVFGRPASDCPSPDANLEATITAAESQTAQMETELQTEQAQINAMQPQSGEAYNQAVTAYNALVGQYDGLISTEKTEVARYNSQVTAYNQCIGS